MSLYSKIPSGKGDAEAFLKSLTLFAGLNQESLTQLARRINQRSFAPDVTLFHQDMPGVTMYMIQEGSVRVISISRTGQEHTFNIFGAGDIFGELSILDGKPRTASAITITPTVVWLLSARDFDELVDNYPAVARAMMKILVSRIRSMANHVESTIFQDVQGRLAYELLSLSIRHGTKNEGVAGIQIEIPLTQVDLASIVGATRESVNKAFSILRARALISVEGTQLTVLDQNGLQRIIEERGR